MRIAESTESPSPDLRELRNSLRECVFNLGKYQARYHGAPHAQKAWERSDAALKVARPLLERGK